MYGVLRNIGRYLHTHNELKLDMHNFALLRSTTYRQMFAFVFLTLLWRGLALSSLLI
jgi:hypothetical protein